MPHVISSTALQPHETLAPVAVFAVPTLVGTKCYKLPWTVLAWNSLTTTDIAFSRLGQYVSRYGHGACCHAALNVFFPGNGRKTNVKRASISQCLNLNPIIDLAIVSASSCCSSKLCRYNLSVVHGLKHRRFKTLISCHCWHGSCKHATPT